MTPLRTRSDILSSPLSRWYKIICDQSPAAAVSITTTRHVCEQEEGPLKPVKNNASVKHPKMYDRAPRTLTKPADSTGGSVGPGSYEAPTYGPKKYGKNYRKC